MTEVTTRPAAPRPKGRSRGVSYQEVLDADTRPVPAILREQTNSDQGTHDISVDRYITREIHDLEKEKIWKRVWQMACREEEIPDVGDSYVYDITDISILVVRTSVSEIKAFFNACPHQGRQLRDFPCANTELRCPFHGFTWNLDGSFKYMPSRWDYPQIKPHTFDLAEVQVGMWGGFVFINMDPDAEPLDAFLGDLSRHFERYPLEDRYIAAHVAKVLRCNWKTAQEAFMEGYHTIATHPQILTATGDETGQYDPYGNYSRAINITGTPSVSLNWVPTEEDMAHAAFNAGEPSTVSGAQLVPDGLTFRQYGASLGREQLRPVIGDGVDELCDSELMDAFFFTVFPNFHPWGAYNRIVYRFRPYQDEPEMAIMETYIMEPFTGERPKPAPMRWLGPDQSHLEASELGILARIFYQDEYNLPQVQKGMHTLRMTKSGTTLGAYQYGKIRHFHNLHDEYLGRP